jgi:hypothetical protein
MRGGVVNALRAATALLLLLPALAAARVETLAGVEVPWQRAVAGQDWLLSGAHLDRWRGLVKVSVAALWLPADAAGRDVLSPAVGKQLEIRYLVGIDGARLRDGTREVLSRNVPAGERRRWQAQLDRLIDAFDSVADGDSYTLTYLPGGGTTLSRNGVPVAHVAEAEVAAQIFSVWLGPQPLNESNKRALLSYLRHGLQQGGLQRGGR